MMNRLALDRSGTSTVELALIMPVLVLLTCMAGDVAMAFKAKIALQRAAERAAQMATAGGLTGASYDTDNLKADAASAANVATGNVSITKTLLCNDTVQTATPEVPCPDDQQTKRYVAITISGNYMPMFAKLAPNGNWSAQGIALTGSASVRLR
ncbi:pilus assembly protein [Sphingobium sp. JS3065]|uniref:TadE/TadG family type IV pilus assembly protein n=1 Tax=Sphingobium sp. JS3065 TaxID=2970925 RepID=UPI0022643399|nr:TadE/TadG family type IV pilus assembly protein [Sphingobium sp. JS3065]UZW55390.1 pilus assembly protein [Sphingobium sp. JS3065]